MTSSHPAADSSMHAKPMAQRRDETRRGIAAHLQQQGGTRQGVACTAARLSASRHAWRRCNVIGLAATRGSCVWTHHVVYAVRFQDGPCLLYTASGAARSHLSFAWSGVSLRRLLQLSVTAAAAPRTGHIFRKSVHNVNVCVCPDFRFSSRNCSYRFKAVSRTLITEHRLRREKNVNASHRPAKTSGSRVFYAPQRARRGRLRYHHHANTLWCEEIIGVDRGTLRTVMPCTPP